MSTLSNRFSGRICFFDRIGLVLVRPVRAPELYQRA
jgi:hypothetical protein